MKLSLKKYLVVVLGLFLTNPAYSYTNNTNSRVSAPYINSVYSGKMMRINDIPLYGKNKHMYFYNEKPIEEGDFHGSGLYLFSSFATGQSKTGVNAEEEIDDENGRYKGGSDANSSMGTVNSFTVGVGREMSSLLSVEFSYSSFFDMKYGKYANYWEEPEDEEEEDEGEGDKKKKDSKPEKQINKSRKVSGGDISAEFIGLGLRYNLERYTGSFGGRLKPYIGLKFGVSQNTINDYTVQDSDGYTEEDDGKVMENYTPEEYDALPSLEDQESREYKDGELNVIGASNRSPAAVLEAGVSLALEGDLQLDLFYKINKLGQVKTSGNVLSTYDMTATTYYKPSDDADADRPCSRGGTPTNFSLGEGENKVEKTFCVFSPEEEEGIQSKISDHKETGSMTFHQYGIKLKYMF